jgi:hypothetical protein
MIYLFTGIETAEWQEKDFQKVIDFAKLHKIDGLIVKVYEVTQGPWYENWQGGFDAVLQFITTAGLDVLPYGYFYGVTPGELLFTHVMLVNYPKFCMNLEETWDNNSTFAATLANTVKGLPGKLWISTWANPVDHHWSENIKILDPLVSVWMPEEYSDSLVQKRLAQFPIVQGEIAPTYAVGQTSVNLTSIIDNASLWEWQDALASPQWVDDFVSHQKGDTTTTAKIILNSQGCVCDVVHSNQLFENEMELCGPWAAKAVAGAGYPGKGSTVSVEDIDQWVDGYVAHQGFTPANFPGVSIKDEENILTALGDHWQEIPSDVATIRKAVQAGYPVLFTANEQNIFRWNGSGWENAYPWKISANHVLPVTGIDANGNFRCPDQLSQVADKDWPPVYDASRLSPSYAVIVQVNNASLKLAAIPSGNPNTWPGTFNAQQQKEVTPVTQATDFKTQAMETTMKQWPPLTNEPPQAIIDSYMQEFLAGRTHGILVASYANVDYHGNPIWVCEFTNGRAEDNQGSVNWY